MDYLDYREQLGIGFSDDDRVKYFFTAIRNWWNYLCSPRAWENMERERVRAHAFSIINNI